MEITVLVECPICCDYLQSVSETPCCHGLFCNSCLTGWSKNNASCPGCRCKLEVAKCNKNIPIQRFIDGMPMECPFKYSGCNAKPARSELDRHKELCLFRPEKIRKQKEKKMEELLLKKHNLEKKEHEFLALSKDPKLSKQQYSAMKDKMASELYEIAVSLYQNADFKEATKLAQKALNLKKSNDEKYDTIEAADCMSLLAMIMKEDAHYDAAEKLESDAMCIATQLDKKEKVIEYLIGIGDIYLKLAKFDSASQRYSQALEKSKECYGPTSIKTGEILASIGMVAKKCSEYDRAIQAYNDAMKIINSSDHPMYSELLMHLADVYRKKGSYHEAREMYLKSMKNIENSHGNNHPQIAECCNALGMLDKKEGKYAEALNYYKTALKIGKHFFGDSHPNVGMYMVNMGDIFRKKGDYKKAEGIYNQALVTLEKALGPNHVEVAEVLNSMGLVLKKRADYDGAELLYSRAISIVKNTFGNKHYKVGIYTNNLGDVERKRGNYNNALSIYSQALKSIEETLGHTHSEAAEIIHNIGLINHQLEKYQEAVKLYNSALKIVRKEFGEKHYKVGMFLNSSGLANAMLNDFEKAYEEFKQALQILTSCLGPDHVEVADCFANLGDVCMKLHAEMRGSGGIKLEEAKKYYTQANKIIENTLGPEHTKCQQFASLLFICDNYITLAQ